MAKLRAAFGAITLVWADAGYSVRQVLRTKTILTVGIQVINGTNARAGFVVIP